MKNLIRKISLEQIEYYYNNIWGYYYGAGYLSYNKIKGIFSNEFNKKICVMF